MPVPDPVFDSRSWREIYAEALARIPIHNPEWTSRSEADPGVTLLQLFAFMAEGVIYRANRIPERNRHKFLRLLGIGLRPATPARGIVAFARPQGPAEAVIVAADTALAAGPVPFRTTTDAEVLPVETALFYKRRLTGAEREAAEDGWRALYASFESPPGDPSSLDYYETREWAGGDGESLDIATDTVDGLWLALIARRGEAADAARAVIAGRSLALGIVPSPESRALRAAPGSVAPARAGSAPRLVFEVPNPAAPPEAGAAYSRLGASLSTDPLAEPSIATLRLGTAAQLDLWGDIDPVEAGVGAYPPSLEDDPRGARLVTWVRIRAEGGEAAATGPQAALAWVGINAAEVVQRAVTPAELLPAGSGEPDQSARLAGTPVLTEGLRLLVNGEDWVRIDDIAAAPPEGAPGARAFQIDPASGEIRFGDGRRGARPPRGASIVARYAVGGGLEGLVAPGAIAQGTLPQGVRVANPIATWGASAAESVAEAERRAPAFLRHRDRVVSAEDAVAIATATPGVAIGRLEALPLVHPDLPDQSSPGALTLLAIPATDPRRPETPEPDALFLRAICEHVAPRRLITTELHVIGPRYVDLWLSVAVEPEPGRAPGPVAEAARQAAVTFLSALRGGFDGQGWPLGRAVDPAEILVAVARTPGVARAPVLRFGDAAGARTGPRALGRLDLPRLAGIAVIADGDDPPAIEALRGTAPAGGASSSATPAPVAPDLC